MATQVQIRRGSTSQHNVFTGATGEITVDTDKDTLVVHDGVTQGGYPLAKESTLEGFTSFFPNVNANVTASDEELNLLDGITATTAELNKTDGLTATATELNVLDGITATTAELNKTDGLTATATELNVLDGITATTAELNKLDGCNATTTELNLLSGKTSLTSLSDVYPVGSIYINATNASNPTSYFGFGTWAAFGTGRVMVGIDTGDADFNTAEETGGNKTDSHALTVAEMPAHTHAGLKYLNQGYADGGDNNGLGTNNGFTANRSTDSTGGGGAHTHDVVQPYIVVYMWKRTA